MKYIFLGTGNFASLVLQKSIKADLKPIFVITEKGGQMGRGLKLKESPVETIAKKQKTRITHSIDTIEINKASPDLLLVCDFGQILEDDLIQQKDFKTINIHPSLLPKYRGPSPIQSVILNGEKETGITIIELDEKIDHGEIIAQKKISIDNKDYQELETELAKLGAKLFQEKVDGYLDKSILPKPQDESETTMTHKFKKEDGKIDFTKNAEEIERAIRAFSSWPGVFCIWKDKNKTLKIIEAEVAEEMPQPPYFAGTVFKTKDGDLAVACGNNSLIIKKLQLEGKKEMTSKDFLNGYPDVIGDTLR